MVTVAIYALFTAAIAALIYFWWLYFVSGRGVAKSPATASDIGWKPTGRIDFDGANLGMHNDRIGKYHLRAEEQRTIASASGLEHKEVRWRPATLGEVKKVVKQYHWALDNEPGGQQITTRPPTVVSSD
jgi:hypothetical protein